jgi:two-component system invasion response regulator UvrY
MPPKQNTIVLVDDHVVMRNGLKEIIELMGNYKIIAQYNNGRQLADDIPFKKVPDLIIMDLTMPIMDGRQTLEWLKDNDHSYRILILTVNTPDSTIISLYKLGVRGYLEKNCSARELQRAIDNIIESGYHHNEFLARALQEDDKPKIDEREQMLKKMTRRELDFMQLVCHDDEYTYDQMADKLNVSRRTVDGYREALFEKFNIKSKTGLVLFAIRHKIF